VHTLFARVTHPELLSLASSNDSGKCIHATIGKLRSGAHFRGRRESLNRAVLIDRAGRRPDN
jgi:hypothetical protein